MINEIINPEKICSGSPSIRPTPELYESTAHLFCFREKENILLCLGTPYEQEWDKQITFDSISENISWIKTKVRWTFKTEKVNL
jgi:hypothetical protein